MTGSKKPHRVDLAAESAVQQAFREQCERRAAILALPRSEEFDFFARHLAEETDMTPDQARTVLRAAAGVPHTATIH